MSKAVWVGAVAYDPKVVTIWEGMRRYFHEEAHQRLPHPPDQTRRAPDLADIRPMKREQKLPPVQPRGFEHRNNRHIERRKMRVDHLNISFPKQRQKSLAIGPHGAQKTRKQPQPATLRYRLAQPQTHHLHPAGLGRSRILRPRRHRNHRPVPPRPQLQRQPQHRLIHPARNMHRPVQRKQMSGRFIRRIMHEAVLHR
jgi:hypothetical protein